MTTSDYLESLQEDLNKIISELELEEGTNFTDIAQMAGNGDISTGGGADLSEYFYDTIGSYSSSTGGGFMAVVKKLPDTLIVNGNSLASAFINYQGINIPTMETSNVQYFSYMCSNCPNIITCPSLDTSNGQAFIGMFLNCSNLQNVPVFNLRAVRAPGNMERFFENCTNLTNESLNNILASCISATRITYSKTLKFMFGNKDMSAYYPASTIECLSNYQAFINAGWTIGWE